MLSSVLLCLTSGSAHATCVKRVACKDSFYFKTECLNRHYYNLSLNIRPKNAGVLFNLGIINRGLNNLSKAKEFFLKSLEVDQKFIDCYLNIARIYEIEKNLIEADQYYQKAFSVNKDYPQLNRAYSKFLINAGEVTKGMSIMYKNFGNIRFGKLNLEIK